MEECSQGALEYLIMLGAILVVVASIVGSIYVASNALGSNVGGQIDNTMENVILPGLVGMISK